VSDYIFFFICVLVATPVVLIARKLGMHFKSHNPIVFDFKVKLLLFIIMTILMAIAFLFVGI